MYTFINPPVGEHINVLIQTYLQNQTITKIVYNKTNRNNRSLLMDIHRVRISVHAVIFLSVELNLFSRIKK